MWQWRKQLGPIQRENRIYILPTKGGALLLAMVLVLVLTGATYNNNLIFLHAFVVFAVFLVSMLQTHANLKDVGLDFIGADDGFEEEWIDLKFRVSHPNPDRRARKSDLVVKLRGKRFSMGQLQPVTLEAGEEAVHAHVPVRSWHRGVYKLPQVILETSYPIGLFRAWKVYSPSGEFYVYPRPVGERALAPVTYGQGDHDPGLRSAPDGDFGELKNHLPGESYHQIAWKTFAKSGQLYTKVMWGADDKHYVLPWLANSADEEVHLRQMSQWMVQASNENASFEAHIPGFTILPGRGAEHLRTALRALAGARVT